MGRLLDVQVVSPHRYVALGERQRLVRQTLQAPRGSITDRTGTDLALSVPQTTIFADPKLVTDPVGEANKLAPVLGRDPGELAQLLHGKGRFVYLDRTVPDDIARRVKALKLDGIAFTTEYKRFTPSGDLASGLIGGTNVDGVGDSGLERQYDKLLRGKPGSQEFENSAAGVIAGGVTKDEPATPGDDVQLTIDRSLQYQTEQLLTQQVKTTGSKGGIAVIMDPTSGEVLADADVTADPDTGKITSSPNNGALTTVFEPGSVNKVITVSAALEKGLVTPQTIFHIPGEREIGGATFTDSDRHPPDLSVTDILTISSNLGAIAIAERVGRHGIDSYLRKFGFGRKTDLGFPYESPGLMLPLDQWSGSSMGSIPLGQGIAVTPIQMLEAYNVIANDGVYVAPKLVDGVVGAKGRFHRTAPSPRHRVISTRVARQVRGMLVNVVRKGTGVKAAIPGYTVAGKTGTARKPQTKHLPGDGYRDLAGNYHYVSTFVGMAPAEHPRVSVIVVMDEPSNGYFAAQAAAPLFRKLGALALRQFQIPPAAPGDDPFVGVPEVDPTLAATNDDSPIPDTSTSVPAGASPPTTATSPTTAVPPTTAATGVPPTTAATSPG